MESRSPSHSHAALPRLYTYIPLSIIVPIPRHFMVVLGILEHQRFALFVDRMRSMPELWPLRLLSGAQQPHSSTMKGHELMPLA